VPANTFEDELALEVLRGEKLRVTILIYMILAVVLILNLLSLLMLAQVQRAFHGNFRAFQLGSTIIGILLFLYLLGERILITRRLEQGKKLDLFHRYLTALIETSVPTAGIIFGALLLGPVFGLVSPVIFWYPIFILLSALRLDFKLSVFTGSVAALEYLGIALFFINQPGSASFEPFLVAAPQHLVKAIFLFLMGVMTGFVTAQIKGRVVNSFRVMEERNRISRTFGQHVSPEVMNKLLEEQPDRRSEARYVCVMFLDIRGFTSFAEKKNPEEVVAYLDSLFEFMIEIVNRNNGIINKFLGDGFMAVFGAPISDGHANLNAVAAAREILARVADETARGSVLPTRVGIGLHAGDAVTGRIGSSVRQEYTVIGDVVNLASRIEQLNKQFDSQLLISEEVWNAVSEHAAEAILIGETQVKGRDASIQVYKLA
jgi:adenylate cyclase